MAILSSVVIDIETRKLRGGAVLSMLHEKAVATAGGSDDTLCLVIAQKASVPYYETLELWIYKVKVRVLKAIFHFAWK